MNHPHLPRRLGVGILSLSMVLVACSVGTPPASSPPATTSPEAPVTSPPSDAPGADPSADPGGIGAKAVVPKPGQLDVHDVPADDLLVRVDGNTIVVTALWTSGVEPCNVLDSVVVQQGEGTYAITLREGHGPEDVACIMIAETHQTEIEIPNVAPGTYRVTDTGGRAAEIQVTVE